MAAVAGSQQIEGVVVVDGSTGSRWWKVGCEKSSVDSHPDLRFKIKFLSLCDQIKFLPVAACAVCAGLKGLKCSQPHLGLLARILLLTALAAPPSPLTGRA